MSGEVRKCGYPESLLGKVRVRGRVLEFLRDAMEAVEEKRSAMEQVRAEGGLLRLYGDREGEKFRLLLTNTEGEPEARFEWDTGEWEKFWICDECGLAEWAEGDEWECARCRKVGALRDDPDYREED